MTTGVDVSHYQSSGQVQAAINSGAQFVIVKATEGSTGTDPDHSTHVAMVRARVVHVGHYHFAQTCAQATAEAQHFLAVARPQAGDAVALDLEAMDGSWPQRISYALRWLGLVASVTGAQPLRYMNKSWLSAFDSAATPAQRALLEHYPLWIATAGQQPTDPGIRGWTMHQYSTAGSIDHDYLAAAWASFAIAAIPPTPIPVPVPKPRRSPDVSYPLMYRVGPADPKATYFALLGDNGPLLTITEADGIDYRVQGGQFQELDPATHAKLAAKYPPL